MDEIKKDSTSINVKAFFQIIWKEKFLILAMVIIAGGLGFWYGATSKEQFTSQGKILPELQGKSTKIGGLAGLANLAGVDLSNLESSEAIRPDLYPDILRSTPFFMQLFKEKFTTRDNKTVSFEDFYHQNVEGGAPLPEKDTKLFPVKENGFLLISHQYEKRIKNLKLRILVDIDKKSGIITITVKMPDPVVAAQVARFSMVYLTDYVTRYRIDKAKRDMDFLAEKVNAAKGKFYSNQEKRAQYSDQFQLPTIRLQSADVQRERIEADYRISSTFYNELLKKYEEAKIKVQQDTPVFQVLEPPIVPTQKSEPFRSLILLIALILGGTLALIIVMFKNNNYKKVIQS
ncbi:Wzz/FepE/Etk N-terminal domain-containing protein [Emticicia sp. 17c]|uniref:Wzz/FepE/Etk N-terminal domain-containing protein n=1 Tax=Emticicia sp. 17c TaxID=3127704 RepID=UPI00301E05E1